jgi:hypothetical protein
VTVGSVMPVDLVPSPDASASVVAMPSASSRRLGAVLGASSPARPSAPLRRPGKLKARSRLGLGHGSRSS